LTVSYCHENNLLHLNLGCHPKWDFCHHKWDCKIPSGVADFSNEFLQKLNQITVKRGGRARAAAHTSHFRWQNFKYSLFITSVILNGNMSLKDGHSVYILKKNNRNCHIFI